MELLHLQLAGGSLELLHLLRAGLSLPVLVTGAVLELGELVDQVVVMG